MLKKISIYGLKAIESLTIEFIDKNIIKGRNGIGKSTIKDAISFVLFGKINNTDRIDDAINNKSKQAKVSAVFNLSGKDYIIERSRTTKGSKPSINGREVEQSDINALFGDHDEFISSNFVGEFMKFSEADKREMLLNKFPASNRAEIFTKLTGQPADIVDLNNLEDTEKSIKRQHKDLEAERNLLSSQKTLLFNNLQLQKAELDSLIEPENVTNQLTKVKNDLDFAIKNAVRFSDFDVAKPDLTKFDTSVIEETIFSFKRNMPIDGSSAIKNEIVSKKAEYERVKASSVCPTCKRPYENSNDNEIKAKELEHEIVELFKKFKEAEENYSNALIVYNKQIASYEIEREKILKNKQSAVDAYELQVIDAKTRYNAANKEHNDKIDSLRIELQSLDLKERAWSMYKIKKDSIATAVIELESKINEIEKTILKKDGKILEDIMKAFGPKGILFQEILSQQEAVNKLLPANVRIEFMKENKTNDGFKPCFEVIKDDISYQWLSTGMKLEVDIILLSLFSRSFMAIIDNCESYTGSLIETLKDKQIIELHAQDSDLIINNIVI